MKKFNTPTAILLWPKLSPVFEMINSKFHEWFQFEADPSGVPDDLKEATCVEIANGVVRSFVESNVNRSVWQDPLKEKDIVLITDVSSITSYQKCRDLLNLVCPVKTSSVVTFAAQQNAQLDAGFRVSVVAALERDVDGLDSRIDLYKGRQIAGPGGIVLGVAAELDQSAFCIVIEHALDAQFVSSSAINAALLAFSKVTAIETDRGQMSGQTVRLRKQLKKLAEERSREYWKNQVNAIKDKSSYTQAQQSIEDDLRLAENVEWIEQLFEGIGDEKSELAHSRMVFLKSELIRLGLFNQFKKRFLDLWPR